MDPRKRRRLVSRALGIAVIVLVVGLIATGFMPTPVTVSTGKVEERALEVTVDEPGRTRLRSKYVVSSPVLGQLARIALRPGDLVEVDQVVAEISPAAPKLLDERSRAEASARVAVAQASLARTQSSTKRAEAALSFAREQAKRSRALHAQSGTSQQALEQAEFQEKSAAEELASAQLGERVAANELSAARAALASMTGDSSSPEAKVSVRAPVKGHVLHVHQESEAVVQPGAPLIDLGDPQSLEIVVDVLSSDAVRIPVGTSAHIERWGGAVPLNARVRKKEPSAFTTRSALGVEEQRVPIVLDLSDAPETWSALGDGYRVEARIRTQYLEKATVVPASALFRENGAWVAFAVKDGHATKVTIEPGARTPEWAEVKRGLASGDEVVLFPSDQVSEGVELAPQNGARKH